MFAIVRDLGHLLLGRNGPLGTAVYDSRTTQRSPWISYRYDHKDDREQVGEDQKVVVQVVHFCSEIGLIDDGLMTENIITSVGIQERFYKIVVERMERQLYNDRYWLLKMRKMGSFY